ncbi:aldo/keto reductase [Subtercola endophyticus]|uniref:aldo/keto reductase n=1 Tax=Subtercola endophyticus TaxID=2895559 RepID=UPI001E35F1A9|nr:aldo/keto reductase [Subtercola endophyticus]UFS60919.1 aldo/keto reductase [Subtercola endophyticus]
MTTPSKAANRPGGEWLLAGHPVARIGYGAMQLVERPGLPPVDADDAIALLHRVVELGITHIDTAEFYGHGTANDLIRRAFGDSDEVVIVSKVGANRVDAPVPLVAAQKPQELRASIEANLRSLGRDRIAVVNLRRADAQPGIIATGDQVVDLDDQLAELAALRDEGLIGAFGLSNVSLEQLQQALPAGIACVQNSYSLVERSGERMLDLCRANDIAWAPFFPLGSAFPGRPKVVEQPAVLAAAQQLGVTPSQVGLAWMLQHAPNTLLIAGTSSIAHLEQNAAIGDITLSDDLMAQLDAVSADGKQTSIG